MCPSASGERKVIVEPSRVASTRLPSQNRSSNGRSGKLASIAWQSGAVDLEAMIRSLAPASAHFDPDSGGG
jgi:hypothetical protein